MNKIVSCCGCVCNECKYFPVDCRGCNEIEGKAFWLEYTRQKVCDIYDCCVNHKKQIHCGNCSQLPCSFYNLEDPTKTHEANEQDFNRQMKQLKQME